MSLFQSQRDNLNILRISQLSSTDDGAIVYFELSIRGKTAFGYETLLNGSGLPLINDESPVTRSEHPEFLVPPAVNEALLFELENANDRTLWLELDSLNNYLAIVPWEQLLMRDRWESHSPVPLNIVRLSPLSLSPALFGGAVNIVLCASNIHASAEPTNWEVIERFLDHLSEQPISQRVVVHVFTDARNREVGERRLRAREDVFAVVIHDPQNSSPYELPERAKSVLQQQGQYDNPWLNWIAEALANVVVDVVHFFCDGFIALDQAEISFSRSPLAGEEETGARFASAQQVDTFLTRIGAYSVAFSSPKDSYSISGLRLLAAQLAKLRTGPVLLHESAVDPQFNGLCVAYKFLYTRIRTELSLSPAITLYCPPALVQPAANEPPNEARELNGLWRAREILQDLTHDREQLAWAVASYRFVEKLAAIFSEPQFGEEAEQQSFEMLEGVSSAINFAADLVQYQARRQSENDSSDL